MTTRSGPRSCASTTSTPPAPADGAPSSSAAAAAVVVVAAEQDVLRLLHDRGFVRSVMSSKTASWPSANSAGPGTGMISAALVERRARLEPHRDVLALPVPAHDRPLVDALALARRGVGRDHHAAAAGRSARRRQQRDGERDRDQRASYQCTPFIRFAIAICSIDAFSSGSFLPDAAAESGNTL